MPATAKGPISLPLYKDGKLVKTLSFRAGDHITDDVVAELGKLHRNAMSRIPHTDDTCPQTCQDASHAWVMSAGKKVAAAPAFGHAGEGK